MNTKLELGRTLKSRRQSLRTTQQALADMAGVSVRMVKSIEGGYANPSIGTLEKILTVLGLEIRVQEKLTE